MNRCTGYTILFVTMVALIIISIVEPKYLSDKNEFLKNFVNHEFLNILGVILAITLASVANIHLAFNRIEEKYRKKGALVKSRGNLKKATYWLIALFIVGGIVVIIKPVATSSDVSVAIFNSISLVILLWHVLILIVLTELVFCIEPEIIVCDNDKSES